jgi:sec-independent protein translocase protein TatA
MDLGAPELLIILVVVLLLFGGAKLPALARSLGQAKKEFQAGLKDSDGNDAAPARHDDSGDAKPELNS